MLDDREYDQSRSALGTNVRRAASGKIASPLASGCAIEQTHTHIKARPMCVPVFGVAPSPGCALSLSGCLSPRPIVVFGAGALGH